MLLMSNLPSLSPTDSVADALHRAILAIDDNDPSLFESAVVTTPALAIRITDVVELKGWDMVRDYMTTKIMPLLTTHFITNVRVNLEDEAAGKASLTAHGLAYHHRPEDAFVQETEGYTTAGLYEVALLRDVDGLWKIQDWSIRLRWTEGDAGILDV